MNPSQLADQIDRIVRIRFKDGEELEALILAVDTDDRDVTYDVRRVLRPARSHTVGTRIGRAMVASLDDVDDWGEI